MMSKDLTEKKLTLRYFVRSYVTKATTMRAIAEIPAKIPRPIGSTSRLLPGMTKAEDVADALDAVSAAADVVPDAESPRAAAGDAEAEVAEPEVAAPSAAAVAEVAAAAAAADVEARVTLGTTDSV